MSAIERPNPSPRAKGASAHRSSRPGDPLPPRQPYRSPRLTSYGRLAEVTRFGGSQVVDSGSGLGNQP
ncbi:MAG: lasso RiPP family leader peptide-containing protein [Thermoanaerobaculia bacterium]|nr:lasso RiPP family leader peptide-containing protein [Thermoanaerobaculia bacterium]